MILEQTSFRRRLWSAIALPIVLLLLLSGVSIWQITRLLSVLRWVDHTDQVISHANYTQKLLLDRETGLRGYLLTGKQNFLAPYEQANAVIDAKLEDLKRLVADNPFEEKATSQEFSTLVGLRILVVDDELDNREFIAFVLEEQQAQVTMAASAAEAFDIVSQSEIDILISDIGMPDEDGYSFLRRIRALQTLPKYRIPAIALTAFAKESDEQEAYSAGFQRHLSKPVDPDKLIKVVASLVSIL